MRRAPLLLLCLLFGLGCGYRLGAPLSPGFPSGTRLAVGDFANETPVAGVGAVLAREARAVVARRGDLRLTAENEADYVLLGRVTHLESPAGTRRIADSGPRVATYELHLRVRLTLVDKGGRVCWEGDFSERDDGFGESSLPGMRANRDEALARVARRLMERAYRQLGETF